MSIETKIMDYMDKQRQDDVSTSPLLQAIAGQLPTAPEEVPVQPTEDPVTEPTETEPTE